MNAIVPFSFESTSVRSMLIEGEPWFVGIDVCRGLGIEQTGNALSRLDEDEKNIVLITHDIPRGRGRPPTLINEPGVYRLIFTSRRPEAERFKRWLAHEVLPALRRTGVYRTKSRRRLPTSVPGLLDAFSDRNQSDWSEYVPVDHLAAAFPDVPRSRLRAGMAHVGFSILTPYMSDSLAFVRYTGDPMVANPVPVRWVYDPARAEWSTDKARYLPTH